MKATKVNAGLAESIGRLLLGIWRNSLHVTCGLTACTPGSAPGPTLGNEYGKTLPLPILDLNHNAVAFVSNNPSFVGYFAFGVSSGVLRILEATHWTGVVSRAKLATLRHPQHRCSLSRPGLEWLGSRVVSVLDSGAEGPGSNCSRDAVG